MAGVSDTQKGGTIRIGIIGAGANTRAKHIPELQKIPGVEIIAVCNRSRESSSRVAEEFGIPRVAETWREVVDAEDIDAVVIGTWPYLHAPVTIGALGAEKHVLCEARMAMISREAGDMLSGAIFHPHLVAQVVPSPFTLEVDATISRLLAEGFLGDLLSIEVRAPAPGFIDKERPLHWRENRELSGNNTLTLGIWYEAVMRWIGEAVKVTALGTTFVTTRRDAETGRLKSLPIPDHLTVAAEMACGAQAHFAVSSVAYTGGGPEVWIYGSEATLMLAEGKLLGVRRGSTTLAEIQVPEKDRIGWRVEEEFIGAIRGEEEIKLTTFEAGFRYMQFTDAVLMSIAQRRAIPLPLDHAG